MKSKWKFGSITLGLAIMASSACVRAQNDVAVAPKAGVAQGEVMKKVVLSQGDHGVHTYRIPGLAVTRAGTLIAVCDARHKSSGDLPGDIDVVAVRSTDNGAAWGEPMTILDYDKNVPESQGNGVGDPTILVDEKTGTIFVVALWSLGNRGYNNSGPGMTPTETGQYVLTRSDDDGLTWSEPVSITDQIKQPQWRLLYNGPGAGIQLKSGELVIPSQFRDETGTVHSCFISSADAGKTWHTSPPATLAPYQTNEAQIAQMSDGNLLLSMRDAARKGQRLWANWE